MTAKDLKLLLLFLFFNFSSKKNLIPVVFFCII